MAMTDQDEWGIRCIYDWYNCTDPDCDNVGAIDNCPTAPNQTQRNADSEVFDLGTRWSFDDKTNPNHDSSGDVCDSDDENDGLFTGMELTNGCASSNSVTDPLNDDSDGDRILDGPECRAGTDPMNAASKPAITPDSDGDGLSNALESIYGTNPNLADSDGDKVRDSVEVLRLNTNALNPNTDGDTCADAKQVASVNENRGVDVIDLGIVASAENHAPYPADHEVRNFDMNRNGSMDVIEVGFMAQVTGLC